MNIWYISYLTLERHGARHGDNDALIDGWKTARMETYLVLRTPASEVSTREMFVTWRGRDLSLSHLQTLASTLAGI